MSESEKDKIFVVDEGKLSKATSLKARKVYIHKDFNSDSFTVFSPMYWLDVNEENESLGLLFNGYCKVGVYCNRPWKTGSINLDHLSEDCGIVYETPKEILKQLEHFQPF